MSELFTAIDDNLIIKGQSLITVSNAHIIDECSGIGARKHETYFTDVAVLHQTRFLLNVVGVDRHSCNIAVSNSQLCVLRGRSIVKLSECVYAIRSIFELYFSENVRWI